MGINAQQILSQDPDLLRRQLAQREMQQLNPQGTAAGAIGALLGRGLGNVTSGRGFFDIADPALKRVSDVQGIMSSVQFDPANPRQYYTEVANALAAQGYSDLAPLAAAEAAKIKPEGGKITLGAELLDQIDPKDRSRVIQNYQSTGKIPEDTQWAVGGSKPVAPGQEIVRAAGSLGFEIPSDVRQFTQEQWRAIDAKLNEDKVRAASASAAKINFEDPKGKFAAISEVNSQVRPLAQQINNLDQAISIRMREGSPFSQRLFEQTVAGAFGDAQKAAAEITRLVNSGTLGQRVENTLSLFLSGKIGQATKEDQLESLNAMRDYIAEQYDITVQPYRAAAGDKADQVAQTSATRFTRPSLGSNKQYIPARVVQQYGLQKGQQFRTGGQTYIYNGDGTISPVGAQ